MAIFVSLDCFLFKFEKLPSSAAAVSCSATGPGLGGDGLGSGTTGKPCRALRQCMCGA